MFVDEDYVTVLRCCTLLVLWKLDSMDYACGLQSGGKLGSEFGVRGFSSMASLSGQTGREFGEYVSSCGCFVSLGVCCFRTLSCSIS